MIEELSGRLLRKTSQGVVVDCAGVGYGVAMSVAAVAKLGAAGESLHLFVHTHLTQDALRLYGFVDEGERQCFEQLLATTGVGPRLALAILSTLSPSELVGAVQQADKSLLVRIPGVGSKKAERLLVELKDRLKLDGSLGPLPVSHDVAGLADFCSALENLGFAAQQAASMAKQTRQAHPHEQDLARLVRLALRASYSAERGSRARAPS